MEATGTDMPGAAGLPGAPAAALAFDAVQIAALALALLAAACLVLGLLNLIPRLRPAMGGIWRAVGSMLIVALAVFVPVLSGPWLLWPAMVALGARIAFEAVAASVGDEPNTVAQNTRAMARLAGALVAGLTALALWLPAALALAVIGIYWLASTLGWLVWRLTGFAGWGLQPAFFKGVMPLRRLLIYPILPFLAFAALAQSAEGAAMLLACYVLIESFDGYQLVAGKLFGRRPAFPRLSPGKTREGLAGGAAMLALSAWAAALWLAMPVAPMVLGALLLGAVALAGDLAASAIKRRAGVKDFPPLLRRQGGALDIFDSLIAAGAVAAVLLAFVL